MGWAYCYVVVQYEDFEGLKKYAEAGEYWFHYIGQDFDPVRWQQKCKQRVEALLGI